MRRLLPQLIASRHLPRLVGGLLLAIALLLTLPSPAPKAIESLRLYSLDTLSRLHPGKPSGKPVLIVDIDLESLQRVGQWPWPRHIVAALLERIHAGRPKAVGLDIVFAEADRTSPMNVLQDISLSAFPPQEVTEFFIRLPDHDALLAEAVSLGPTVLGYAFTFDGAATAPTDLAPAVRYVRGGHDPLHFIPLASYPDRNLPELEARAGGIGFFNATLFGDGVLRNVPSVIGYNDEIFPSLALEMLRLGEGAGQGNPIVKSDAQGLEAIRVGHITLPTDRHGNIWLRYRGGAFSFPYVSAAAILADEVPPETFDQAYVLIGTSAPGLMDLRTTPFAAVYPGVEVHATLIDMALAGDFLHKPAWVQGGERLALLLLGLLLMLFIPRLSLIAGGLVTLALAAIVVAAGWWSFVHHRIIADIAYPLLVTAALFIGMSLSNYLREAREKRAIRGAFGQYLSPAVIDQLVEHPESLTLTGEEREMSILFSDIRNFTAFSEGMEPHNLTALLNDYMTPMSAHVLENQGTLDKYIGDAIMAFWNAPLDDPDHATHACLAAVMMQRSLIELRPLWLKQGLPEINIGIGINSGLTHVGNMGSRQRFNYTVIGDTVNLASRLEGLSKNYGAGIVISAATKSLLDEQRWALRQLDRVRVKGKREPVVIYELVEERARLDAERLAELADYHAALERYFARDFSAAAKCFGALQKQHGEKTVYQLYQKRIVNYLLDPPPDAWDGVTTLTQK